MSTPPKAAQGSAREPEEPSRTPGHGSQVAGPLLDRPDPSYIPTFRDVLEAQARILLPITGGNLSVDQLRRALGAA
ncbi:hypothetical protein [Limnochorda pilosa]|uniref:Uncharacterized protein n=1 Tax=Limnochorda pilosa TaxID=1555112 RepID=A0A0K2SKK5_LIMPI|nr:hypothetical protein [Limnochorda pilosa]BAS27374.1 hypothetical protein LIP_1527 [Limnochorda pilosa]